MGFVVMCVLAGICRAAAGDSSAAVALPADMVPVVVSIFDADGNGLVSLAEAACGVRVRGQPCAPRAAGTARDCGAFDPAVVLVERGGDLAPKFDDLPWLADCIAARARRRLARGGGVGGGGDDGATVISVHDDFANMTANVVAPAPPLDDNGGGNANGGDDDEGVPLLITSDW